MNSIRTRLLAGLIGTVLPLVLISYVVVYMYVSRALWREFDGSLRTRLESYATMAEWEGTDDLDPAEEEDYVDLGDDPDNRVHFDFVEFDLPEYRSGEHAEYYQVSDLDGFVYARSPSLAGRDFPVPEHAIDSPHLENLTLPGGGSGRVAVRTFIPKTDQFTREGVDPEKRFVLVLARPTEDLLATLALLRVGLLGAALLTVGAATVLVWYIIQRGLRPLDEISSELQLIGGDDPERRVETASKPNELLPVCMRLNDLLDRLNEVIQRERRFTSNVAHELRTPVAELRAIAEVSAARQQPTDADRRSFEDTAAIAVRMERLITALLELARCSSGQLVKDARPADLAVLVEANWKPFEEAARAKGLDVHLPEGEPPEIRTDPVILGTILTNLFSNAVEYTPPGGRVDIGWIRDNGAVEITVANTAEEMTTDDVTKLFDLFWRKNGPDTGTDNHLGLGLALVQALSRVLGVTLEGRMAAPRTLEIKFVHPL